MNRGSVLVVWIILAASCGHKVQARLPGAPPEHELLYRARLEATGKRLQKATDKQLMHFAKHPLWLHRVASIRCISPSHFFFSPRNRSYNWEEFEPRESEPVGVIDSVRRTAKCETFEPFVNRLRGGTFRSTLRGTIDG